MNDDIFDYGPKKISDISPNNHMSSKKKSEIASLSLC